MTTVKLSNLKEYIEKNITKNPCLILLSGTLGSGKTTFSRTLLDGLGLKSQSPTYTLINHFENEKLKAYHIDLYRLTEKDLNPELYYELQEIVHDEQAYCLIEWPEKLEEFKLKIDRPHLKIKLSHTGNDNERKIESASINN